MAYKDEDKIKARDLYIQGYSITDIHRELNISRGTLTGWMNEDDWKFLKANKIDLNVTHTHNDRKELLKNIIESAQTLLTDLESNN
jgi:uncharacterized protein YjcR